MKADVPVRAASVNRYVSRKVASLIDFDEELSDDDDDASGKADTLKRVSSVIKRYFIRHFCALLI